MLPETSNIKNGVVTHDAHFAHPDGQRPPFDRQVPTLDPSESGLRSLDVVILRDGVPPPACALRGPTWLPEDHRGLEPTPASLCRAARADGHARGGTRRAPRPGRARGPD